MRKIVHGTHPTVPLSNVVEAGGFLFVSGQLPFGPDGAIVQGDAAEQTRVALTRLAAALQSVGAEMENVVKTTVWLTDARDFADFNAAYREFFPDAPPARSTVVSALVLDARVEIEAVAWRPTPAG